MVCTAAAWGLNFVAMRVTLEVFSPGQMAFARAAMTLLVLLPWWQPWRRVEPKVLVASLVIGALSFYLMYAAIGLTDSLTTVAIGTQLMAPITAILALIFYREPVSGRKWLGISIATLGAMFIAGASGFGLSAAALGLTVIAVSSYSAGSLVLSKSSTVGIWRLLAWISAAALIPLALLAAASGPLYPDLETLQWRHWVALVYAVLISALLGQAVLFFLYRKYPVADVAPYVLFIPVFAALFSILVYQEHIGLHVVLGGSAVLLGVWIQQGAASGPDGGRR
jgi:O-acetylserine/cysteine efflux transporter